MSTKIARYAWGERAKLHKHQKLSTWAWSAVKKVVGTLQRLPEFLPKALIASSDFALLRDRLLRQAVESMDRFCANDAISMLGAWLAEFTSGLRALLGSSPEGAELKVVRLVFATPSVTWDDTLKGTRERADVE